MRTLVTLTSQAPAAEVQALILTGAGSEAAARPLLEAARKRVVGATDVLQLAAGFPKLVQSETVSGLKPGFWIVLAGFCESDTALDALKALDAGAYARPVQLEGGLSCPRVADGWSVTTNEVKVANKRTLRGVLFTSSERESTWKFYASLREKSGALISERVLLQHQDSPCVYGGENELQAKGATLVIKSTDCAKPRGCPNPGAATVSVTLSAVEQTIAVATKVLKDPGYEGCSGE